MIAKHVVKDKKISSSFARLARYIADIMDKGEKLDYIYTQNLAISEREGEEFDNQFVLDTLQDAIDDVNSTQKFMETHSKQEQNYHLLLSFQNNEKPNKEQVKDLVNNYCKALGYAEHERIIACHSNTDNYHIHVAINKVNPNTYKLHEPWRDYMILARTTRKMELKHGFNQDNNMFDKDKNKTKIQNMSDDIEANTWQQSFYSYCKEQKPNLNKILKNSQTWQDIHDGFSEYGLSIEKKGVGLVIKDLHSKNAIKASNLGREYSKKSLEKTFGTFKKSQNKAKQEKNRYAAKPITKHEKTNEYFKKFNEAKKNGFSIKPKMLGISNSQLKKAGIFKASFKLYLEYLALDGDLLALAIMQFHKQIIKAITTKAPTQEKNIVL